MSLARRVWGFNMPKGFEGVQTLHRARPVRATALLALAIASALVVSACADEGDPTSLIGGSEAAINGGKAGPGAKTGGGSQSTTPKISAKQYFAANVQTTLGASCGGCHSAGPAPIWIAPQDVEKSYALQFQRGYVTNVSAIMRKGAHATGGPALTNDQTQKFATWVELEVKERGDKAPASVLEKLGGCLDLAKFKAIGFEKLVTVPRTAKNNPKGETENTDECVGCNQTQCSSCHSADPGSGFLMALGNDVFEADHTFNETKSVTPPYIQKYFGMDVTGTPIASKAIKAKSDATVNTGKAYQHPMFVLTPEMDVAIEKFVDDAISKYKAGSCGK
jgi:hypothetical protein